LSWPSLLSLEGELDSHEELALLFSEHGCDPDPEGAFWHGILQLRARAVARLVCRPERETPSRCLPEKIGSEPTFFRLAVLIVDFREQLVATGINETGVTLVEPVSSRVLVGERFGAGRDADLKHSILAQGGEVPERAYDGGSILFLAVAGSPHAHRFPDVRVDVDEETRGGFAFFDEGLLQEDNLGLLGAQGDREQCEDDQNYG